MRVLLFSILLSLSFNILQAQSVAVKQIDSLMQVSFNRGIFNGNILVAQKGKVIYQKSWGYADANRTIKLRPDLKFDMGSICKEFNGTAIMILKERGLLKLDDPVAKFLPQLPQWAQKVKIRHLINYTSGIPNVNAQSDETDEELLKNLMALKDVKFEPGSAYIYSHYNVYLQMRIIEKISGLPYAEFIRKNILIPAHMTHTIIDHPVDGPGMARAFDNDHHETKYAQGMTGWLRLPVTDLYQWTKALESYQLISRESFRELAANFAGGESSLGSTGFDEAGNLVWHQHQGSNSNYEALLYSNLKDSVSIIMMTNNQNLKVHGIKSAIISILKAEPFTIPRKSIYLDIRDKVFNNTEQGLAFYRDIKTNHPDNYDFSFEIGDLISTGKYLQRRNKLDDAISIFHAAALLNAKPGDISYAYELIGECYFKKGDHEQAILYYQKAQAVEPANKNAAGMLNELLKTHS